MEVYTTAPGLEQILMTYSLPGGRVKRGEADKELAWCMAHSRCSVMFCEGGIPAHLGGHLPSGKDTCPLGGPLNRASEQKLCYTLGMAGGAPEWSGLELEGAGPTQARAGQWVRSWDDKTEAGAREACWGTAPGAYTALRIGSAQDEAGR